MMLPLTAVLGSYGDGDSANPEMSDEDLERHQKSALRQGPANVYLHGNAAAMLCKAIKNSESGEVKVCVCSTKGIVHSSFFNGRECPTAGKPWHARFPALRVNTKHKM